MERWHAYSSRQASEIRRLGGQVEDPPPPWPEPVRFRVTDHVDVLDADPNVEEL
jgi:hypothetical protein